jgi:succinoglycan biosynthesis transport protein ExoP
VNTSTEMLSTRAYGYMPGHLAVSDVVFDPMTSVSFSSLLGILRRSLWWIAIVCIAVLVITGAVLHSIAPRYQAQSVLHISTHQPPLPSDSPTMTQTPDIDDLSVNSQLDAILAQPVLHDVVQQLRLDQDPEFNPDLAVPDGSVFWETVADWERRLRDYLRPNQQVIGQGDTRLIEDRLAAATSVFVKNRSRTIVIQVTAYHPGKAAIIANAITKAYLQNRLNAKLAYTKQLTAWLDGRLDELRGKVTQSEEALDKLRASVGQYAGQSANPLLSEQLSQIARQLIDAQAEKGQVQAKVDQLGRLTRSPVGVRAADSVLASPLIANLQEQKAQLDTQRQEQQSRLGPKHPDIKSINSQIAQIDAEIAAETARITHNAADQLKEINARVTGLQKAKSAIEGGIDTQSAALVHIREMQAQADSDRKAYEAFAIYRDKLAGLNEVEQPEAQLVSAATPPIAPAYPRDMLTLAAAGLTSLLLSIAYAILRPSLDTRFQTAKDVATVLGLPTLATIQRITHSHRRKLLVAEGIRYLYTALERPLSRKPLKILVSSSLPREGKTTIATMLAREAASDGRETLLIDLDIRHQQSHATDDEPARGLNTPDIPFEPWLRIEQTTGLTRLSFRTTLPQPFKLLYNDRFWKELSDIMMRFDLVVIDSPPILSVPDAKIIAGYVDKTVFIVRWRNTHRAAAIEGVRHFRAMGADVCGVVLTQVDSRKQPNYYGYGDYIHA